LNMGQSAGVEVVRAAQPVVDALAPQGCFKIEHWRGGVKIADYDLPNAITNEGRAKLLNVMFNSVTEITTWYMGLVDSTTFSALAATDSYAQIGGSNGWKENINYTDTNNSNNAGTRPAWGSLAVTLNSSTNVESIANSVTSIFTVTSGGSGTVKGLFLVGGLSSAQSKSDATTGNVLWSVALFSAGDVAVLSGDQLKVTYTVSA